MRSDLGTQYGQTRPAVDMAFKDAPFTHNLVCIACGQPAKFKLIAKRQVNNSAYLEDKGYVCKHHLQFYDPLLYGVREV